MNNEAWERYEGIIRNKRTIEFIKYGFPIGHNNQFIPTPATTNHTSALDYPDAVDKYINTELNHKALIGPFTVPPFTWTMVSPLMTRPKSSGTDRRIIMDLSYPSGRSVNDGIPKQQYLGEECILKLPTALTLRDRLREQGKGALLWSIDIERAYRQLRCCPLDWPLLGLKWHQAWYVDRAVPFGVRTGANAMQQVSDGVVDILRQENHFCIPYIDDLAGADIDPVKAEAAFRRCSELLAELGITEAIKKQCPPTSVMTWLGIQFDCTRMEISIPRQKIKDIHKLVLSWKGKQTCRQTELKSLLGKLFFAATCSATLRLFCNRLLATLRSNTANLLVALDTHFYADIEWISDFLQIYNGLNGN